MKLTVTGHRPNKLFKNNAYSPSSQNLLVVFAKGILYEPWDKPIEQVITGMALGWDQAVAEACISLGVPFCAAVPFKGQESRWPPSSQRKYQDLISKAARVHTVSPGPYSPRLMQVRNEWMVDHAEMVLALWDKSPGGTKNCVDYATRRRVPLLNVWERWAGFRDAMMGQLLGTLDLPVSHASTSPRAWRWCACSKCGLVSQCLPREDYYNTPAGLLLCAGCHPKVA